MGSPADREGLNPISRHVTRSIVMECCQSLQADDRNAPKMMRGEGPDMMQRYIHERPDWPRFHWDTKGLGGGLSDTHCRERSPCQAGRNSRPSRSGRRWRSMPLPARYWAPAGLKEEVTGLGSGAFVHCFQAWHGYREVAQAHPRGSKESSKSRWTPPRATTNP